MSKFKLEDGQTDGEKNGTWELLGRRGASSQSCKVTRAIWNVHDQPEPVRRRPAIVPGRIQDHSAASNSWRVAPVTQYRPRRRHPRFFGHFRPSVWPQSCLILTSNLHHRTQRKEKPTRSEIMILKCSFPLNNTQEYCLEFSRRPAKPYFRKSIILKRVRGQSKSVRINSASAVFWYRRFQMFPSWRRNLLISWSTWNRLFESQRKQMTQKANSVPCSYPLR